MIKYHIGLFQSSVPITARDVSVISKINQYFKTKQIAVTWGELTGHDDGYRSGTAKARAHELMSLVANPNLDCIMSVIGGYNTNAILPYLDFDMIGRSLKEFIGFSDTTNLLLAIYAKTGQTVFYGPAAVPTFSVELFREQSFQYFNDLLIKGQLPYTYHENQQFSETEVHLTSNVIIKKEGWRTVKEGQVTGRLIGGNLHAMCALIGTPYMPIIQPGDILFLEDEKPTDYRTERSLTQLVQSISLKELVGLIIGRPHHYQSSTNKDYVSLFLEHLPTLNCPILANVDCSHTRPIMTLPIGGTVTLDATNKKIIVESM